MDIAQLIAKLAAAPLVTDMELNFKLARVLLPGDIEFDDGKVWFGKYTEPPQLAPDFTGDAHWKREALAALRAETRATPTNTREGE
jgi:hypothetical protein